MPDAADLLLAASDGGEIIQLVVFLVIAAGSALVGWLKKRHEQSEGDETSSSPPPAPEAPQRRWPPVGSTSGTTIPGRARPVPPRAPQPTRTTAQTPPIAMPVPTGEEDDPMRRRAERMEAEIRQRSERVGRQTQQTSSQTRQETQDKTDRIRAKSVAAERIRLTAEQARRVTQQAAIEKAALQAEHPVHRIVPSDAQRQPRQMPQRLRQLLAQSDWRAAILMAEILSPPVGLRDPRSPGSTTPPSLMP